VVWHWLAGAQTEPPLLSGAQQPLLHSESDVHATAQIVPRVPPVFTQ
jgi:hypothetical protein